jgi:hypothetical protein
MYTAIGGAAALIILGAVGVAIHIKRREASLAAKSVGNNALAPRPSRARPIMNDAR